MKGCGSSVAVAITATAITARIAGPANACRHATAPPRFSAACIPPRWHSPTHPPLAIYRD